MKLWGVALVRNEGDVIEAFVRHNLTVLDGLVVVDHGSSDETPGILRQLRDEGLPLTIESDRRVGFYQDEVMTSAVRRTFSSTGADFVFALDGDEFVRTRSRPLLESVLGGVPSHMHAALRWQTYVPDFSEDISDFVELARRSKRLEIERHGAFKVIVARHFLDTPDALIIDGNHSVFPRRGLPAGTTAPQAAISTDVAALAHVPIRSRRQFVGKVATTWLGRMATGRSYRPDLQTVAAYNAIRNGENLTAAFLLDQAVNWTVKRDQRLLVGQVNLLQDAFLADIVLRYTPPSAADPLLRILVVAEDLASELARQRAQTNSNPAPSERPSTVFPS